MSPPHNATNGWTSRGAAADFKDFAKDGERGDKYGMSGGPTVVTQDLTEALGRLTVVKDKTGDVGRALKAVRQVLGMPSDEPPWADLDPLEQGARRSAFRNALEEMRRFLENKEKLLINGPSRTSAVDPEETRLELRDEPPYVWCKECEAAAFAVISNMAGSLLAGRRSGVGAGQRLAFGGRAAPTPHT